MDYYLEDRKVFVKEKFHQRELNRQEKTLFKTCNGGKRLNSTPLKQRIPVFKLWSELVKKWENMWEEQGLSTCSLPSVFANCQLSKLGCYPLTETVI